MKLALKIHVLLTVLTGSLINSDFPGIWYKRNAVLEKGPLSVLTYHLCTA